MEKIGYLRISTQEQRPDRQIDALKAHCDELFIECASAATLSRPVYEAVIKRLQPGDTLVVLCIDRAFRSTVDAVTEAERFLAKQVQFQILNLNVDTATADGMFAYTILAAVATHERMRISERTKQGLAAARKRGKRIGRPPKLSDKQLDAIRQRLETSPVTLKQIAAEHSMAPWSVTRALRRQDDAQQANDQSAPIG